MPGPDHTGSNPGDRRASSPRSSRNGSRNSSRNRRNAASRYGYESNGANAAGSKASTLSGKVITIVAVIALIATIIATGMFVTRRHEQDVSISLVHFSRVDDETMKIWTDVTREDTSRPSYCIVTAVNYSKTEVGRREFVIPAGGERIQRIDVEIPSRERPVSADVYGCSTTMPAHLKVSS